MYYYLSYQCLALLVYSIAAYAFDFSFSAPTSCDNLTLSWSGGSAPFQLLITPLFFVPINFTIPSSAVDESTGMGSFSVTLNLTAGQKFLLTMSDSTGFNAGGTSQVLQVGSSVSGASCNTTNQDPSFFFQLNTALTQCRTFTFSDYDNATQPVRILGLIPLGEAFELDPPSGPTSFDWTANVANGTSIAFLMTDAKGRQGGSSSLLTVGDSDSASCLDASSPHSTISSSSTQAGQPLATETIKVSGSEKKTGAIVGGVLGGLALIALTTLLALCFMRRRRKKGTLYDDDDDRTGTGAAHPHRPPPVVFIGGSNSRGSRISRVRSSLLPASRARFSRANRSFDLLPNSARQSRAGASAAVAGGTRPVQKEGMTPVSENYYLPSPYIFPSSVGGTDGHSAQHSVQRRPSGVFSYEPHSPTTEVHTSSNSRSHSRSHSYGQTSPSLSMSPSGVASPVSVSAYNRHSRGNSRHNSQPLSFNSSSGVLSPKTEEAGTRRSQQRFILHRDADDVPTDGEEDEVVELPPQYTDRIHGSRSPQKADEIEDSVSPSEKREHSS